MKEITLNPLDKNQRTLFQVGAVLILLVFLMVYFFIRQPNSPNVTANNQVFLEGTKLQVFNDTYEFNGYPDKILMHYPYFMVVESSKPRTTVYNLETKQKETEFNDIILDYYQGNVLVNRKETYFNDIDLRKYCDSAFIKSENEILCITKKTKNSINNRLIRIRPEQPNLWTQVYESDNILTTVSVINERLYVGEINYETKKNYLTVDGQANDINDVVSLIYPMQDDVYMTSFASALNNQKNSQYLINDYRLIEYISAFIYFNK